MVVPFYHSSKFDVSLYPLLNVFATASNAARVSLLILFSLRTVKDDFTLPTSVETMHPQLEQQTALCRNLARFTSISTTSNDVPLQLGHDGVTVLLPFIAFSPFSFPPVAASTMPRFP